MKFERNSSYLRNYPSPPVASYLPCTGTPSIPISPTLLWCWARSHMLLYIVLGYAFASNELDQHFIFTTLLPVP